ncbi:MAG: right-handed parallel beta-helix repeat-containing protein [Candidatus Bipolaricaulota bacterium]|nr:right-handed parallel beta-helix repeat-containing protein [Candidatus Bipolaricaulota bacterium]MDW8030208.1 right-handed parallel beta-helix repeat-containing protein [Candidatus Bipolaricaulota bacterium]
MRLVKLLGLGAVFIALAVVLSKIGSVGLAQADCTATVKPGESIQKAIDAAPEGAIICLTAGAWEENIIIRKSLTLRGAGQEYTSIKSKPFPIIQLTQPPVILIQSSVEKSVLIEGLNISGARLDAGVRVQGKAKATFSHVRIFDNGFGDLVAEGSSQITVANAYLSRLSLRDSSRADISKVEVYQGSVNVQDSASLVFKNSRVVGSVQASDSAQASITGSTIYGGISVTDFASVRIISSLVSRGGIWGVYVADMADLDIRDSRIVGHAGCGIWVLSHVARVSGTPNEMRDNGADLCGYAPVAIRKPLVPETQKLQLSVPDDYKTIQEAVDALAPGGTVHCRARKLSRRSDYLEAAHAAGVRS